MKILITGAGGQVGSDAAIVLSAENDVTALSSRDLNIADPAAVERLCQQVAPEVILNCAAFTKVDACESEQDQAWNVNVIGPENLARCALEHGSLLVHLSTDYVFDGKRDPPSPYVEEDTLAPLSCYGKTKLEGEKIIQKTTKRFLIVRTAWVYGINGHNFLKTILKKALQKEGETIPVVNDQYGSPTWSYRLVQQIAELIKVSATGIYHVTSEGFCTWFDLTGYFLEQMGIEHKIVPCSSKEYPTPAARPGNSILENQRLKKEGINLMRPWKEDVDEFAGFYQEALIAEAQQTVL